ncbi:MAG TPA: tetratricopeptide repeat protein [Pyrinomonadaceae bacterium]|nr:tetratricopeptide repeat protein [Pyrinomonadaceae bacterium]
MTRENLLFAVIGVLAGFIVGFLFASNMAQRQFSPSAASTQNLPANHPPVSGAGGDAQQTFADVQASMKKAREEPQNFEAQVSAARLEYQIQRFDEAIGFLLKANRLKPDDYETIANLGMVNLDAGHYDQSIKWYKAALMKKPDDISVVDGLCAAALGAGDTKEAEACILKLEKLDPQNVDLKQFKDKLSTLKAK